MIKIIDFNKKYIDELFQIQNKVMLEMDKMSRENFFEEFQVPFRKYFIAIDMLSGKALGFIGLFECDLDYNIMGIAVDKDVQNQGIGTKLLEKAIDCAINEGKTSLSLEVDEQNVLAQKFYKKNGFKVEHIRKKYYGDNDALIMFLHL